MFEIAAITYGFLTSFVLSSLYNNRRRQQRDPAILLCIGWFLCGASVASAVVLGMWAFWSLISA